MTAKARIRAVDRFIKGCKEDGIYADLQAACVMAGWDSLAGALTPLVGAAPTNSGLSNYDRGIGIAGDGSSYLDSGRAVNADGDADHHIAAYITGGTIDNGKYAAGSMSTATTYTICGYGMFSRNSSAAGLANATAGLTAVSRSTSSEYLWKKSGGLVQTATAAAIDATLGINHFVFAFNHPTAGVQGRSSATLSFYSIGSSLGSDPATGLAALDARVSTLMADLRAIEEAGFDRDAIAYIRAVEEADGGAYLETDVKVAINNLVSGLKSDGLWDAIGSSCLLCGPRTLAGALVPLRGDAPTPYGFVSGDHSRTDGLRDPDGTSYLDSGFNVSAEYLNDVHISAYSTLDPGGTFKSVMGAYNPTVPSSLHMSSRTTGITSNVNNTFTTSASDTDGIGFVGVSRTDAANANARAGGTTFTEPDASTEVSGLNVFVFARNNNGSVSTSDMRLAFYSAGTFLDLAKLDSHVSAYVTAIGAAI